MGGRAVGSRIRPRRTSATITWNASEGPSFPEKSATRGNRTTASSFRRRGASDGFRDLRGFLRVEPRKAFRSWSSRADDDERNAAKQAKGKAARVAKELEEQ